MWCDAWECDVMCAVVGCHALEDVKAVCTGFGLCRSGTGWLTAVSVSSCSIDFFFIASASAATLGDQFKVILCVSHFLQSEFPELIHKIGTVVGQDKNNWLVWIHWHTELRTDIVLWFTAPAGKVLIQVQGESRDFSRALSLCIGQIRHCFILAVKVKFDYRSLHITDVRSCPASTHPYSTHTSHVFIYVADFTNCPWHVRHFCWFCCPCLCGTICTVSRFHPVNRHFTVINICHCPCTHYSSTLLCLFAFL